MMGRAESWVHLEAENGYCGAGVVVTRKYIVTAEHVLRERDVELNDKLSIYRKPGEEVTGRAIEIHRSSDLALIAVDGSHDWTTLPPSADNWPVVQRNHRWLSPFLPEPNSPQLMGLVLSGPRAYQCASGAYVQAVELKVEQGTGGYRGYSGGPVERDSDSEYTNEGQPVGLLVEQLPRVENPEVAANVVFAITIQFVLETFREYYFPQPSRSPAGRSQPTRRQKTFLGWNDNVLRRLVQDGELKPERAEYIREASLINLMTTAEYEDDQDDGEPA